MKYLPGAQQMKTADQYTIRTLGVSSLTLMERAAGSCVNYMKKENLDLSKVCIVCGSGNNGGDGIAIGRLLLKERLDVTVVMAGNMEHCSAECDVQIQKYRGAGGKLIFSLPEGEYSMVVDALFGVGLSRKVEGKYAQVIEWMNQKNAFKLAVDLPSGICADTGSILGTAFRADVTVTFQTQKFGSVVYPGKEYSGKTVVADIGISEKPLAEDSAVCLMPEISDYVTILPERKEDSNKGSFGKVLVIAGSKGMSGAAYFNAKAAYMAGAGLVRICTPEENRMILQQLLPEAIVSAYDDYEEKEFMKMLSWADVICIGSGIGTGPTARKFLQATLSQNKAPCVIDADGLNILAELPEHGKFFHHKNYVLTPHLKEMSRLTGVPVEDIRRDRRLVLSRYVDDAEVTCIMKDARTLILSPDGPVKLNPSGNCAMAKAGSGDVLAGVIAGMLAQGISCEESAVLGTYIHGRAGDLAREEKGCYSVMAEDLIHGIGKAINELLRRKGETEYEGVQQSMRKD